MKKQKKSADVRVKANKGIFIAVVIICVLAALWGLIRAVFLHGGMNSDFDMMLDGRTIDCQPAMSESEAKLCKYAEERGYEHIVY